MSKDDEYIYITSSTEGGDDEGAKNASLCGDDSREVKVAPKQATIPPAQTAADLEYCRPGTLSVSGATAPDGTPWIHVKLADYGTSNSDGEPSSRSECGVWTRLEDWADETSASPAKRRLREANIHLFENDLKDAISQARKVSFFPSLPLIERRGWTNPHFAFPSGEVISPEGTEPAVILFETSKNSPSTHDAKPWLEGVAHLAAGQSIITFALAIPFAAPLLSLSPVSFNPGFELTGPKRKGKSTLQQLVASAIGVAVAAHGRTYIVPANTTVNALEDLAVEYADLPLIVEEMAMYYADETEKVRQRKMLGLVMRLASGTVKSRKGEPSARSARFVYLTSSNESFSSLFHGSQTQTSSAAGDRLLTIPISDKRKYGIFDKLPKGCINSRMAIGAIVDLVESHHGAPMRVFVRQLVADRAADEGKLKQRIEALINEFRDAVGVDDNVGNESSIADVFGLMYAALVLAQLALRAYHIDIFAQ